MKRNILFDGLRSIGRIGETVIVAAQAGVKYATEKPSNAKLMRETFESLGSTYIKLGQFIASTPSLFPREYVEEFQGCLDQTPTLPFSYIQGVLNEEFEGRNLNEIFSFIDEKPLASASIAQVHAAKLVTGEDVVLKVQKPGVETILYTDLNVVHWQPNCWNVLYLKSSSHHFPRLLMKSRSVWYGKWTLLKRRKIWMISFNI